MPDALDERTDTVDVVRVIAQLKAHRMAIAAISAAEKDGRLSPGDTVVEYTGGTTGTSLALVCAVKGYPIHVVSSTAFSREKLDHMAAYGAAPTLVPYDGRGITKRVFLDMIEAARALCSRPHTYWTNQLENPDMAAGYAPIADEAWARTRGQVDAFVQMVGTSPSLRGVAAAPKHHNGNAVLVAVDVSLLANLLGIKNE